MNWKYAVGEVCLVVIGILLALAASDWYEGRRDRAEELTVLRELRTSLTEDRQSLAVALDSIRLAERRVAALREHLAAGGEYSDSLDLNFGAAYGLRIVSVNPASFESLKSRGLGLISDAALRTQIARLYDLTYARLTENQLGQRSVILDALRPYFLTHFRDLNFNHSATPLDYAFIRGDVEFLNLLDYRLQVIRVADLPTHERTVAAIDALLAALAEELDE